MGQHRTRGLAQDVLLDRPRIFIDTSGCAASWRRGRSSSGSCPSIECAISMRIPEVAQDVVRQHCLAEEIQRLIHRMASRHAALDVEIVEQDAKCVAAGNSARKSSASKAHQSGAEVRPDSRVGRDIAEDALHAVERRRRLPAAPRPDGVRGQPSGRRSRRRPRPVRPSIPESRTVRLSMNFATACAFPSAARRDTPRRRNDRRDRRAGPCAEFSARELRRFLRALAPRRSPRDRTTACRRERPRPTL